MRYPRAWRAKQRRRTRTRRRAAEHISTRRDLAPRIAETPTDYAKRMVFIEVQLKKSEG